jgi:hypothetical protein
MLRTLTTAPKLLRSAPVVSRLVSRYPAHSTHPAVIDTSRTMATHAPKDVKVTDPASLPNPLGEGNYIK